MTREEAIQAAERWIKSVVGPPGGPFSMYTAAQIRDDLANVSTGDERDDGWAIVKWVDKTVRRGSFRVDEAINLLGEIKEYRESLVRRDEMTAGHVVRIDHHGGRILSRDELAAAALTGIVAGTSQDWHASAEMVAERAYRLADAMEKARCRSKTSES